MITVNNFKQMCLGVATLLVLGVPLYTLHWITHHFSHSVGAVLFFIFAYLVGATIEYIFHKKAQRFTYYMQGVNEGRRR